MASTSGKGNKVLQISDQVKRKKIGIVTAEWNDSITSALEEGCLNLLKDYQIPENQITVKKVPGSFEVPLGAQYMAEYGAVHAVVCLGCLIRGETSHFHYIAETVTKKIGDLNLYYNIPLIYGILTVENEDQAKARSGGQSGNKGAEAAEAALQMLELRQSFQKGKQQPGFR